MTQDPFGLPRDLGDGLVLRWATADDIEAVADFNVRVHSDNPDDPATFLADWTRDLMNGKHPTTKAGDFTVVVDERAGGKVVSTLNLISQRWAYEGIEFGVGRPELVGTLPEYRRRGLVRQQMAVVHALSASRGELLQAITGIPWYYRQFGYEMALNLGGGRTFLWQRSGNLAKVDEEPYRMRPATAEDIPVLMTLYTAFCARSSLVRVRDAALWRYEMLEAHPKSGYGRHVQLIETPDGQPVAYVEYQQWGSAFTVRELGVQPGHSWRAVALFVTRALKAQADELNKAREKPIRHVDFGLGDDHPVY
ncbi:MAG: GNAT family N-acetyltransferase, partial [Anaerolineales bacterium]|nr:GNAT family N-acetyltransferase [Anaerolineales bacterium]